MKDKENANESLACAQSRKPNKLESETSTYLRQHAYNPVEWYPWGKEALAKAREEDRPILLSIGYSACHWCHVMEHESFEDESTAELMNRFFVNIKVDREERPDLDEIYMKSVQIMTGHGGWPMTVFLTPDLKPFYAGTYFPPQDRHGIPSFKRILHGVRSAWENQRAEIEESSSELTEQIRLLDKLKAVRDKELNKMMQANSLQSLLGAFDPVFGGFGSAPKFPHTASLSLVMRYLRDQKADEGPDSALKSQLQDLLVLTLNRMAWGGIHDQLAGGFARYSVDRRWLIPHFEKMLYDNALIPRNYFDAALLLNDENAGYWKKTACGTLDFVLSELGMPEGGFYSSLDADSEGEEGKYYVWTPEQIKSCLGEEDGEFFCRVFDVTSSGNFEHGNSALNFPNGPEACRKDLGLSAEQFEQRLAPLKKRLLQEREKRVRPGRDDKMLVSWSGLMISALVDGYKSSSKEKYLAAAVKASNFILDELCSKGRLLRTYGLGKAKLNACLDDYAYFIQALLDLAQVQGNPRFLLAAIELNETVLAQFWDEEGGGFFYTSDDHEELITRSKLFYDGSTPSASSVSVMNLIRLGRLSGRQDFIDKAERTLKLYAAYFQKAPDQFANMLCALDTYLSEPLEIVVVFNDSCKDSAAELACEIYRHYFPAALVAMADLSDSRYENLSNELPLFQGRVLMDGKASVYICRNFSCKKPISDLTELQKALQELKS